MEAGRETEGQQEVAAICSQFQQQQQPPAPAQGTEVVVRSRYKAGFCTQLRALLWRTGLATLREPLATKIRLIQAAMVSCTLVITVGVNLCFIRLQLYLDCFTLTNLWIRKGS